MPHMPESLFGCHLLGSFNGPEPGDPELTIRKWKRERERERERKTRGSKLWWSKGILLAEMQAYISLVGWLLSYYTGWNFINSHSMDRLIHTKSLTLKRVTERSYWKESKQIPRYCFSWSQSWELHADQLVLGIGSDKEQRIYEKQHVGILLLNIPWYIILVFEFSFN